MADVDLFSLARTVNDDGTPIYQVNGNIPLVALIPMIADILAAAAKNEGRQEVLGELASLTKAQAAAEKRAKKAAKSKQEGI